MKCPSCGHTWATTKRSTRSTPAPVDTASLTVEQMYAFYKRTSHIGDVAFFAQAMRAHPAIRNQAIVLLGEAEQGLDKRETLRRLARLQESWRSLETRPADSEDRFWAKVQREGAREHGRRYREQRDQVIRHLREAVAYQPWSFHPTPTWCRGETIDDMIDQVAREVRDLVRAARAICPAIDDAARAA